MKLVTAEYTNGGFEEKNLIINEHLLCVSYYN